MPVPLKLRPCPHCMRIGHLNRHGHLRGYGEGDDSCAIRGIRIFCCNRGQRGGCGATHTEFAQGVVPGCWLLASTIWSFLSFILQGLSRIKAASLTKALATQLGRSRRLWKRFSTAQMTLRANLCKLGKPPDHAGASHVVQTIAHMACVFKDSFCPVSAYMAEFSGTFP